MRAEAAGGAIFDGFPRCREQAEALEQMPEIIVNRVIWLNVPEPITRVRMEQRVQRDQAAKKAKRGDDLQNTVTKRLAVYRNQTLPLKDFYGARGVLCDINSDGTVEDVWSRIVATTRRRPLITATMP